STRATISIYQDIVSMVVVIQVRNQLIRSQSSTKFVFGNNRDILVVVAPCKCFVKGTKADFIRNFNSSDFCSFRCRLTTLVCSHLERDILVNLEAGRITFRCSNFQIRFVVARFIINELEAFIYIISALGLRYWVKNVNRLSSAYNRTCTKCISRSATNQRVQISYFKAILVICLVIEVSRVACFDLRFTAGIFE